MKLKNILFIAIAILTIGLFVACNDEVVATKDNNVAYTQVLESNGAFEYAGTKYETLQDALNAIADSKTAADGVIKVLRNVSSDAATVPSGLVVGLNLNGKTLSFLSANGITVDGGLHVTGDGEFAFSEGVTDGTAITVSGTGAFYVEDAKFNVPGQNAVKATGGTVYLCDNTEITGNIEASGTSTVNLSDNSKFTEKGTVTIGTGATVSVSTTNKPTMVLNLEGGTLEVSSKVALDEDSSLDSGVIVLPSAATDNYIEKPESLDISQITMSTGLFSISRTTGMTYYKSLQDAIVEYESSDLVITQIFADTTDASIGVEKCVSGVTTVKINTKNNGDTSDIGALTVSAGYTLEVSGNGSVASVDLGSTETPTYGTLRAVGDSSNKPTINKVTGTGVVNSENAIFNGTIACTTLTDGANGSGSTFKGAITAKGLISLSGSILDTSIIDESNEKFVYTDAADNGDIASITLSGVTFNYTNQYAGVFSAEGGSISISNSIGKAFKIIATNTGSNLPKTVTINNSNLTSGSLTVVDEVASRVGDSYYGNVSITGRSTDSSAVNVDKIDAAAITISHATVTNTNQGQSGARARSGNFISDNCVFNSVVEVFGSGNNLTDGDKTTEKKGSTFKNGISVDNGSASFYSSTFNPSVNETQYTSFSADSVTIKKSVFSTRTDVGHEGETTNILYNITADKTVSSLSSNTNATNLTIENSTGYVGSLNTTGNTTVSTNRYSSDILVDNSSISSGTLSVGAVSSTNAGNTVFGDVTVKGNSPTTGDDPKSRAVTVASIPYANHVKTSYAVVTGDIGSDTDTTKVKTVSDGWTDPSTVAGYSTFNGNIYASGAGTFNNSIFAPTSSGETAGNKNLKALSLSISGSTFTKTGSTPAYVYSLEATKEYAAASNAISISSSNGSIGTITASNAGSISIESTTGEIGNISLSATTDSSEQPSVGSIVINNSAFSEASTPVKTLSTVSISARYVYDTGSDPDKYVYGDITVRGGSASNTVTVASIPYANNVKTSYAVVTGDIGSDTDTTKVKTVSDGWTVSESTTPGYSTFNGNIYASGAGTFYDSTFSASGSDKTLTAGNVTINRGDFVKDSSDNRYNVYGSSVGNGVTINDSTGYLGAVESNYVIIINNDEATDDLFINPGSGASAVKANGYDIEITGPNASDKKIDIEGLISGNNITMTAGTTANGTYDDTTLVVHGIGNHEFYSSTSTNIYGGTYGVGESILFSGNGINIHKGTFYVGSSADCLKNVAEHIHSLTSYKVNIVLGGNIELGSTLNIGNYGGVRLNYNKEITFSTPNDSACSIYVYRTKYNYSGVNYYYTCYPVNIYSGKVLFDHVSLDYNNTAEVSTTSVSSDSYVVLRYCDSIYGSYEFVDANIRRGTADGGLNP